MPKIDIEEIKKRLQYDIKENAGLLLEKFPLDTYLALIDRYPKVVDYHYIDTEVIRYTDKIIEDSTQLSLELYHQMVLVELISRNIPKIEKQELPEVIKQYYMRNFERILTNISSGAEEPGFYLYSNEIIYKELAVCTQRLIPLGAGKVCLNYSPRKFIFANGFRQFLKGLYFFLFELHGFKLIMYEAHLDSHDPDVLREFNPEGRRRFYINAASLLKQNREIKGIYGCSWLYDPKLEEVSPHLAFIRKIVIDNGGKLFYMGPSERGIKDALAKSNTRRKLYAEGKYMPTEYMMLWSRQSLIDWANRVSGNE